MTALLDRLLGLWQEPVDKRDDPEAAFRELYADPVSINGTPMPVSSLVDRHARCSAPSTAGRPRSSTHAETPDRVVIAFCMRAGRLRPGITG
jgi:hypothetical protein